MQKSINKVNGCYLKHVKAGGHHFNRCLSGHTKQAEATYLLLRKTCHRLLYIIRTNGHKSADLIYMTLILTYIKSGFDMCRKKKDDDCVETCLSIHVPMLRSKMSPSSKKQAESKISQRFVRQSSQPFFLFLQSHAIRIFSIIKQLLQSEG